MKMSDLDDSRRHGVPIDPRHTHDHDLHLPQPQLSAVNENQTLSNGDGNGLMHSSRECSMRQHQTYQHGPLSTCHVPQHLQQNPSSAVNVKDLDGELSGLQAAAAKTALFIHGKGVTTGSSLDLDEVVTTEEEDDYQSSHWIYRRHVGFSSELEVTDTIPPPPTKDIDQIHHGNGVSGNLVRHQLQSANSCKNTPALLAPLMESSTLPNNDLLSLSADQTTEKSNLIQQLNSLRQQRQHLQQTVSPGLNQHLNEWNFRLSSTQQSYETVLSTLESASARRIWAEEEHQLSCKWHVLGDVFFIWHRGPFGTINGFRLGKCAATMVGLVKKCAGGSGSGGSRGTSAKNSGGQAGGGKNVGGSSLFSWGTSDNNAKTPHRPASNTNSNIGGNNTSSNNNNNNPNNNAPEKIIVPWNEINSALGQVVFLLYTLRNAPHSGISFQKHALQPCGCMSKIGILKKGAASTSAAQHPRTERRRITALAAYYNTGTPSASTSTSTKSNRPHHPSTPAPLPGEVTWYNLHHYEENGSLLSMGYYARRNFNTALEGLLHCIAEACLVVEKRDMALAAPYIMRVDGLVVGKDLHGNEGVGAGGGKDGEATTVGGLPMAYDPTAGEQWTMVCKYLLTNLKWLIAYAAKHVDR